MFSLCVNVWCVCVFVGCVYVHRHMGRFPPGPHCDFGGSLSVLSSWATSSIKKKKFILTVLLVSMKLNVIQTGLRLYIFLILKEIRWFHGTLKVMWPRTWVSRLVHSYFSRSRNIEDAQTQPRAWVKGHSGSWGMELGREWALHMNLLH